MGDKISNDSRQLRFDRSLVDRTPPPKYCTKCRCWASCAAVFVRRTSSSAARFGTNRALSTRDPPEATPRISSEMAGQEEHVCKLAPPPKDEQGDDQQPTFGLTPQDKKLMRDTWNLVKADPAGNGLVVFKIFFTDFPHNINYFPFKLTSIENLPNEPVVKSHAIRVIRDITACVDNLDKPETLLYTLRQNALNHRKRNIKKVSYDELRLTILKTLATQLGPQICTPEVEQAWDKALRVMFQVITEVNEDKKCMCPAAN